MSDNDEQAADLQIGEVAERTGVTQRTLRFYEEKGLLRTPTRMDGGFRLYSEEDVKRVEKIRKLQDLLGISVWKNDELNVRVPVRPDGKISVPLVDDVQAEGLTVMELKEVLDRHGVFKRYEDRFLDLFRRGE